MTSRLSLRRVFKDTHFSNLFVTDTLKIPRYNGIGEPPAFGEVGNTPGMQGNIILDKSTGSFCWHTGVTWVCAASAVNITNGDCDVTLVTGTYPNYVVKGLNAGDGITLDDGEECITISSTGSSDHPLEFIQESSDTGGDVNNLRGNNSTPYTQNGVTSDNQQNFLYGSDFVNSDGTSVTPGAGFNATRMYWISSGQGATGVGSFRAGISTGARWDLVNVGRASVAFGEGTLASGSRSAALGGQNNLAVGSFSAIVGGASNVLAASPTNPQHSGIFVGHDNTITNGQRSIIAGGNGNSISSANDAAILSGIDSSITSAGNSIITGGNTNTITAGGNNGIISGGRNNTTASSSAGIFAGHDNTMDDVSDFSAIVAGETATISQSAISSIVGGTQNTIAGGNHDAIINGQNNSIGSLSPVDSATYSVIAGGQDNTLGGGTANMGIFAGQANSITNSNYAVIVGGFTNSITDSGAAIITGGSNNTIDPSDNAVIIGGTVNAVTDSDNAGIFGGRNNTVNDVPNSSIVSAIDCQILTASDVSNITASIQSFIDLGTNFENPESRATCNFMAGSNDSRIRNSGGCSTLSSFSGKVGLANACTGSALIASNDCTINNAQYSVMIAANNRQMTDRDYCLIYENSISRGYELVQDPAVQIANFSVGTPTVTVLQSTRFLYINCDSATGQSYTLNLPALSGPTLDGMRLTIKDISQITPGNTGLADNTVTITPNAPQKIYFYAAGPAAGTYVLTPADPNNNGRGLDLHYVDNIGVGGGTWLVLYDTALMTA